MTARVTPDGTRLAAARLLLTRAYGIGPGCADADLACVLAVAADVGTGVELPAEVLLAAITLLHGAREQLDRWELEFIDAARNRGLPWAAVGRAVGYGDGPERAKQGAAGRRRRLAAALLGPVTKKGLHGGGT